MSITLLSESDLRQCIKLDDQAVKCIEQCFHTLATQRVVMPPIMSFEIPEHNGDVDVKTAYLPGVDSFAIKMSPGFFDNPKLGLPSVNGLMVLFSSTTGIPQAVLLDNGYLTNIRTAAAGAVAAKHLSRKDSQRVGIIGAGVQAGLQLEALRLVRDIQSAKVWSRDAERATTFAKSMSEQLGLKIETVDQPSEVCHQTDIIVTTTPATQALLTFDDLHPGQHITAMGSDAAHKQELASDIIAKAYYTCDHLAQVRSLGELRHAIKDQTVPEEQVFPQLGHIIAGLADGRHHDDQITVCDLTGTGAQDTAIASLASQLASSQSLGSVDVCLNEEI